MKAFLGAALLLSLGAVGSASPGTNVSTRSQSPLAIVAVTVDLQMSIQVTDADTGAAINGAAITLVRSGDGTELASLDVQGSKRTQVTGHKGVAHFRATFAGNLCTCGWIEAYAGNSYLVVTAPKHAAARAWVSTPSGRLDVSGVDNGKVEIQLLDTLRFKGKEARRKVSYHVLLHRDTNS
jgi:hypothetical protein